ncbi:MAG TPA: nicotinate-nucleotide--dimethylbenzimidazole phosphoribosyltransferase [Gemmataceae bacterium]|nr:nicotinate-nucleotide--dimethylbenzimidazole phosphoribosyltransferase [Gemmataceae bacterium]
MLTTVAPLDPVWSQRAAEHQARLTMPTGALGRLLDLGRQLCAVQETLAPRADPAAVLVFAADHGIAEEGVSAYPPEVTAQMVANFRRGGAAINVLARRQGASLHVIDVGVKGLSGAEETRVGNGSANFLHGPAMSEAQALRALEVGRRSIADLHGRELVRVVALGEMGIGNTTSASALSAALTGQPADAVTGRGTGLDGERWRHKVRVVEQSMERHFRGRAGPVDPVEALTAVGGFEIAALAGAALEAAARRLAVVLDGFISAVGGLLAARLQPTAAGYFIAAHAGAEPGHRIVLDAVGLRPLLDLGLRLGEGSGAALALNLVQCAADIMRDMATFEQAGVSDRPDAAS